MVLTSSTRLQLGTTASPFSLLEPRSGKQVSLEDVKGDNGVVVIFMCNHCPFVVLLQEQLQALGRDLPEMGIGMVGISSNDYESYPQDSPTEMKKNAQKIFDSFPYLIDETQEVAKAYHAACTPDLFLFDRDLKLVYRGQVDDARPGNGKDTDGASIRTAAKLVAEGKTIPQDLIKPAIGCNIKWRKGNEPDYAG